MKRREFIGATLAAGVVAALPRSFWAHYAAAAPPTVPAVGPYGPLLAADANGVQLPAGFTSRVIATTGQVVGATGYRWHSAPDGGGCVAAPEGGWVYVSNSEVGGQQGGCSAIRFSADGSVTDAYSMLSGTDRNCAGGMTPWATWLSCEEAGAGGDVFECDPFAPGQGVIRPRLGRFNHEAAVVDPATSEVYLTEDDPAGRLYKFVPDQAQDLSSGELFAAVVTPLAGSPGGPAQPGTVSWLPTSSDVPDRQPETAVFAGAEGIHIGNGVVFFSTKLDRRIWQLDLATADLSVAYDATEHPDGALDQPDNLIVHGPTGRVFVAEDSGNMELIVMSGLGELDAGGNRSLAAFCRIVGHAGSEVAGPAFSPDGTRLYLSSQRGADGSTGVTYEISGPFVSGPVEPPVNEPVTVRVTDAVYIRGGSRAAQNFFGASPMQVCRNGSDEYTRVVLVSLPLGQLPALITRATLRVRARVWAGGPSAMEVVSVTGAWDSRTVTWNTRPAEGAVIATFDATTTSTWFELDVTDAVADAVAAGDDRVAVGIRQVTRNGPLGYLDAPGSTGAPELVVIAGAGPEPEPEPEPEPIVVALGDAHVRGGSFSTSNYSTSSLLQVCNNGSEQYTRWALLQAMLPMLDRPLRSAVLRINARASSGGPWSMSVSTTSDAWEPSTVTWATRPSTSAPVATFDVADTTSRWYEIDVTASLEAARQVGLDRVGFVLRQQQRNGPLVYANSSTHWTSDRPELVIVS